MIPPGNPEEHPSSSSTAFVEPEELDDRTLIKRCLRELPEQTSSYQALVRRHYPFAYHVAMRVLDSREDSEEVAQDAMLQVFHKLPTFEGRSAFRSWLYIIVLNVARNRISKNKTRRKAEEALASNQRLQPESTTFDDPSADRIQDALRHLDPMQREIITMRYLSGMSLDEIASFLDIGVSAVKMRLYRAMDAFKTAWDNVEKIPPSPHRP